MHLIWIILVCCCLAVPCQGAEQWGVARVATPVLNTPQITNVFGGQNGRTLKRDSCGQVRELEFIALPGTPFRILSASRQGDTTVYRVETGEYPTPAGTSLYLDSRFVETGPLSPGERQRRQPVRDEVLAGLRGSLGSPYVWGGNLQQGVPQLLELYYRGSFSPGEVQRLSLAGLDCSGLLYQATGGWSPRNTSSLINWGQGVAIAGRSAAQIAAILQPLDLVVWNGHVLIVLDRETIIESRLECGKLGQGGVVTTLLRKRLEEIMRTRRPADAWPADGKKRGLFVVRRWLE